MRIGILGGTFDPIHHGHLIGAEQACDFLKLDKVYLVPAKLPPHKLSVAIAPPSCRMELVRRAVENSPKLIAHSMELDREGPSYTLDTVIDISREGDVFLVMGHDSFAMIETWHNYKRLFDLAKIVVLTRPGFPPLEWDRFNDPLRHFYPEKIWEAPFSFHNRREPENWRVCVIPITGMNISSSEIREKIQTHQSIRYLVPDRVIDFIEENHLYRHSA
jgi:nicotinate-nucleotide adenylyltransferase